jgi:hypothetical protein
MKTVAVATLGASIGLVGGCSTSMNERPWLGQTENMARGGVVYLEVVAAPERPEHPLVDDPPSLTSLDRSGWRPVAVVVPVDGVASRRTYAYEQLLTVSTARQRGDFPTEISALELSGGTRQVQALEGLANPLTALVDGLVMVPRMIVHCPAREVYNFPRSYWRADTTTLRGPLPGTQAVSAERPEEVVSEPPAVAPAPERPEAPASNGSK